MAKLNEAYRTLLEIQLNETLNQQIKFEPIHFPQIAFNQKLQIQILQHFETLLDNFNNLETEDQKEIFLTQHQHFLNIRKQLSDDEASINADRIEYYYSRLLNKNPFDQILFDIKTLIIKTYGEENLDDFFYRNAMITGDFSNILDIFKLLSPLKCISFILSTIKIVICDIATSISQYIILDIFQQFFRIHNSKNLDIFDIASFTIKSICVLAVLSAMILYFINASLYICSLMLITDLMEYIANPMSRIIRPLADYFDTADEIIIVALTACAMILIHATFFFPIIPPKHFQPRFIIVYNLCIN